MRRVCVDAHMTRICACYAHIMRTCAYYEHMHVLCVYAHIMRICAPQRQSPSREGPKCCISLRILEGDGESSKKHWFSSTCEGKFCSMTFAKHTPATLFRVTHQKLPRPRAASEPIMQIAVTLDVLGHVRPCKFHIPAIRVHVKNPIKP